MGFNFGKVVSDIMNDDTFRGVTKSVGGFAGNLIGKGEEFLGSSMNVFSSIGKGVSNIFGSSMLPYILLIGGVIFISMRSSVGTAAVGTAMSFPTALMRR